MAKLSESGEIVYASYLSGANDDKIHDVTVAGNDTVVATGLTFSNDFPTKDPFQNIKNSNEAAFLTKIQDAPLPLTGIDITLDPNNAETGSGDTQVKVTGKNFDTDTKIQWNGSDRATTFVSKTELRFTVLVADLRVRGTAKVRAVNRDGTISNEATFTINNPSLLGVDITLSPINATAGSSDLVVNVNGRNFVTNSVVQWNGADRATTSVNSTQLRFTVPPADMLSAGTAQVRVVNPDPNGSVSNSATFTIYNPELNSLSIMIAPDNVMAGSGETEVTITGTGFNTNSKANWNGAERPTTYVSATELKVKIPVTDLSLVGTAQITVVNPAPGGGTSNPAVFAITPLFKPSTSGSAVTAGAGSGTGLTSVGVLAPGQIVTTLGSSDRSLSPSLSPLVIEARIERNAKERKSDRQNIIEGKLKIIDQMRASLLPLNYGLFYNTVKADGLITSGIAIPYSADRVSLLHKGPLPTELNGLSITVIDSSGAEYAGRKFSFSPTHLNWIVPAEVQDGPATLVFKEKGVVTATESVNIERTSPGIFTLDSSGTGAPTAMVLRGKIDGTQIKEPIASYDAGKGLDVHIPIDLGEPTDQVLLVLCGTGFRNHLQMSNVTATVGGVPVEVYYAGPTNEHVGLDQVNVLLPSLLVGLGEVPVVVTFGAKAANTVVINIK